MTRKRAVFIGLLLAAAAFTVWQFSKRGAVVQPAPAQARSTPSATGREAGVETAVAAAARSPAKEGVVPGRGPIPAAAVAGGESQPAAAKARSASFAAARVPTLKDLQRGSEIVIPLPGGEQATGVVNLALVDPNGVVRVGGRLTGSQAGSFSLSSSARGLGGRVLMPDKEVAYVIMPAPAGSMHVQELPLSSVICYPFPREPKAAGSLPTGLVPQPRAAAPLLSSRPSATAVLYLVFDGATVTDPDWNAGNTIVAPASTLTNAQIVEVWNRVREDYWPFNIDITTDPTRYASAPVGQRMRIIITENDVAEPGAGGVAMWGSFSMAGAPYYVFNPDVPAWVFNSSVNGVAEAISHELGHTLALDHDGRNPPLTDFSDATGDYYYGHGNASSAVGWAPIMGAGYYQNLVQWSQGEYLGATNQEDDIAVVAGTASFSVAEYTFTNNTGFIPDEAGDSRAAAATVDVSSGSLNTTGIISNAADSDFYAFTVGGVSNVTINADPPGAYAKQANLDIQLELQDGGGNVLAGSNPDGALNASVSATVGAGTYYIKIQGAGRAGNPGAGDYGYSNYGSIGSYAITGTVAATAPIAPSITNQSSTLSSTAGSYSQFHVTASGTPAPAYQWQRLPAGGGTWADLSETAVFTGTHAASLAVAGLATMNGDQFRCVVSNVAGSATSNPMLLTVSTATRAVAWVAYAFPSSAATGSSVSGTATLLNAGTAAWGANDRLVLYNSNSQEIGSASLSGVNPEQAITVTVNFTAPYYEISSAFNLQPQNGADPFLLNGRAFSLSTFAAPTPPNIVSQPASQEATAGSTVNFSVIAVGQTPFSYQWRIGGVDIPGATNNTLTLINVQPVNSGAYTVLVSNALGSVLSNACTLTVAVPPAIIDAAAGAGDTIFLRADGSRWILGSGFSGQLGDGTTSNHSYPVQAGTNVTLVKTGGGLSFFTKADGTLWAAGFPAGLFAGLTNYQQSTPVPVTNASSVVAMAADYNRDLYFIRSDGTLWATGQSAFGAPPVQIATDVTAVAAGSAHAIFLKADGAIWGLGSGSSGALGPNGGSSSYTNQVLVAEDAVAIAAGGNQSAYLTADGSLWAFGLLGQGLAQVATNVTKFSVGGGHIMFIKSDASLWAVGQNAFGQLGDGITTDRSVPVQVATGVFSVSAGMSHTVFIKDDGSLWGMGDNQSGEISASGSMSNMPVMIASGTAQTPVASTVINATKGTRVGYTQLTWSLVVGASGYEIWRNTVNDLSSATKLATVYSSGIYDDATAVGGQQYYYWIRPLNPAGAGAFGTSDVGYSVAAQAPVFSIQPADTSYLSGGNASLPQFTVAVSGNPAPRYQWQVLRAGTSTWVGTAGDGETSGATTNTLAFYQQPTLADSGNRYRCVATNIAGATISAEATLTVTVSPPIISSQPHALTVNPGSGGGFSVSVSSVIPVTLQWRKDGVDLPDATDYLLLLSNLQAADAGSYSVRATNAAGSIVSDVVPLNIVPGVGVVSASTSATHSLFVRGDQTLWGMGDGVYAELGMRPADSTWPSQLTTGVAQAAAGYQFSVFVKTDGTLWLVGRYFYPYYPSNGFEILSGQSTYVTASPVQLASGVAKVAAGYDHIVFLKIDGTAWTLGKNNSGQLGDGTIISRDTPVQVAQNVTAVAASSASTFFIKQDGTLWATGANYNGNLGDGTNQGHMQPVLIDSAVREVACGDSHTVYLKNDDTVWGMGVNYRGELGTAVPLAVIQNYTLVSAPQMQPVQIANGFAHLTAGNGVTLLQKADGTTWAMGNNIYGGLGDGTTTHSAVPVAITAADVVHSSPGVSQSLFVRPDGSLWSVGQNYRGLLGVGTVNSHIIPAFVTGGPIPPIITVQPTSQAAPLGTAVNFSVTATSPVAVTYQWQKDGVDLPGATAATYNLASFQPGDVGSYTVVVTNSAGSVTSNAATLAIATLPVITAHPASQTVNQGSPVTFTVTVTSNAPLSYEWRKNGTPIPGATAATYTIASVQAADAADYSVVVSNLAGSDTSNSATLTVSLPVVPVFTLQPLSQVAAPGTQAFFNVAATGAPAPTYQWQRLPAGGGTWSDITNGADNAGMQTASLTAGNLSLGHNGDQFRCVATNLAGSATSNAATLTVAEPAVVAAAAGATHSFAMQANGLLLGFGGNSAGELGTGDTVQQNTPRPYERVLGFATSWSHSLFIKADGTLWGMGGNANGQLGDGTTTARLSPTQVPGATDVALVATGLAHSLFIKSDGTLWGMGGGAGGRLGDGTGLDRSSPIPIATGVVAVTGGVNYTGYVRTDGSLWTMGNNGNGQLGDGTTAGKLSPVHVADNVATVAAHGYHLLILKQDGTLWSTGMNLYGQLGDGTTTNRSTPFQIASGVAAIASGTYHTLYVKTDGTLWATGNNTSGQLGNGTTVNQSSPVQVATGVAAVAGGNDFSLFIKTDGSLWGMGSNATGQLIGGGSASYATPVQLWSGPLFAPETPTGLSATDGTLASSVSLTWSPVPGATRYEVWRHTVNNAAGATRLAGTVPYHRYEDATPVPSTPYYYWVKAASLAGASAFSAADSGYAGVLAAAPQITGQPAGQTVTVGANVTFTVTATAPLGYQWRKDGSNLADGDNLGGATGATLTITGVTLADAGSYDVVVSNVGGTATSEAAILTVNQLAQTITFAALADRPYTAVPFTLDATASSGLPVVFSIEAGPATLAGNDVTMTGAGLVTVRAAQSGDSTYAAAAPVDRSFTVTAAGFASWQTGKFTPGERADPAISGPHADPDHDGFGNLLEYALGLEPMAASTTGLPEVGTAGSDWTYTYSRPSDRTDVTYEVEMSTNLTTWTTAGVTHEFVTSGGGTETWHAKYPLGSAANCFFRLKITQP